MCSGTGKIAGNYDKEFHVGRASLNRLLYIGKLSQSPAVSRFESRSTVDKARRVHPAARSERQERVDTHEGEAENE